MIDVILFPLKILLIAIDLLVGAICCDQILYLLYSGLMLSAFLLWFPYGVSRCVTQPAIQYIQITLLTFGWVSALKKTFTPEPTRSVPVADDPSHRVHSDFKGNLATTPQPGVGTLYDLAKDAFQKYGARNCMGSRQFLGWKEPNKVKHFGDVLWRSFAQVGVDAHRFGAALRKEGVQPAPETTSIDKIKTPCRIAIFENTCAE